MSAARRIGRLLRGCAFAAVCALSVAISVAALAGYREVAVTSGSMRPTYEPGDALVVRVGGTPGVGDVVVFHGRVGLVAHRMVRVEQVDGRRYVVTRGDANRTADAEAVAQGRIYGRVVVRLPAVGRALYAVTTPQARLVLLALLVLVVTPELWALCVGPAAGGRHRGGARLASQR